jgi:hypothetical protein
MGTLGSHPIPIATTRRLGLRVGSHTCTERSTNLLQSTTKSSFLKEGLYLKDKASIVNVVTASHACNGNLLWTISEMLCWVTSTVKSAHSGDSYGSSIPTNPLIFPWRA